MKAIIKPSTAISPIEWNRQMHWVKALQDSHKKGQHWIHQVPVYCREGYEAMLDDQGNCMVSRRTLLRFIDNEANQKWYGRLLAEAKLLMEHKEWEEAAEKVELAKLISSSVDAHLIEIDLLVAQKELEAAKARFTVLFDAYAHNAAFLAEYGRLCARLGDYRGAVNYLSGAAALDPMNCEIESRLKLAQYFAKRVA